MLAIRALLLLVPVAVCAQDADPSARIKQARDLGKQGSEGAAQLGVLIKDPSPEVRREAAKSLANIGTQYCLDPLTAALADSDAEVQIRATDGLINFYMPGYLGDSVSDGLRRSKDGLSARWRKDVYEGILDPDVPVRQEIVDGFAKLAGDGNPLLVRANTARAIGIVRGRSALPMLIDGLRSKDDRLIFECLIAIQKLRDPEAGPRVVFLLRDLDDKIQATAIETVGILRTGDAVSTLQRVVEDDPNKKVRRAAITALGRIASPSSQELFLRAIQDRDEEFRAAAAEGLGRLGRPEDRNTVAAVYKDESKPSARLAEAFALVELGDHSLSELSPLRDLINHLNSRAWRGVASPYLGELLRKDAVRAVVYTMLLSASKEEKRGLAMVLAGTGATDAVPPLEQLRRDPDLDVANDAVRALRILRASIRAN